ncbi:MAG TPA: MATE family efflux transporter [Firmicutes bacterium]|jgi:putative MATE family efflux protein|nr:MATE family efflux transporter [Bacillota bacterium]HAI53051.1 MATE family efflux transporter [Bacillota bacterium]HAN95767.1 MATE family efflux transporter [Bacillota bacterium]
MRAREHFPSTNRALVGQMVMFALPIMAVNLLQLVFNAADMIVVGRFEGARALAAVGATGSLFNLIVNLFMGLSVGTAVIVAQDYGARRVEGIRQSVHTSIAVSLIGGGVATAIGLSFCAPLLRWMGTPEDIIGLSTLYMRIVFAGMPASMVFNFGAAILRAVGDSRRPMYFLVVSGAVNVVFNLFFVAVLRLGVAGVGWATVISQYLALILIMISLSRQEGALRFQWQRLKIHRQKLVQLLRIGVPAGLQSVLFSISNVLIQSAVNSFGTTMVAASAASSNVENLVATPMNAYYQAAITFTGQSMGAEDYDRIDRIAKNCTALVFVTWLILGGITLSFGRTLLAFYTTDPAVIELGMRRMKVLMSLYFTCGIMNVFPGLTRAMGYSVLPMLSTLVGACLLRIVWLATVFRLYPTQLVLFAVYPVTWTIAGLGQVASFFYARSRIRKRAVLSQGQAEAAI